MKFFIGLGNPGDQYQKTRHNIGFFGVDMLAQVLTEKTGAIHMKESAKLSGEVGRLGNVVLLKPSTYMNDSGRAVQAVMRFYQKDAATQPNVKLENVFVIHDDLDIEVGKYKIQLGTGPKVHNGLSSIYQHLHTENFWHVRIGVDGRKGLRTVSPSDYVLSGFSPTEKVLIQNVLKEVTERLFDEAMTA
jgi:PTH1 family peptidyl-tRNA hydrolase